MFWLLRNDENPAGRNREELEFLPAALEIMETPPSPRKQAVLMLACLMVIAALLCSWFGRVDIVAVGHGRVVPGERAVTVRALHDGIIERVFCEEGMQVGKGDRLLAMDATETATDLKQQEQLIQQAREAVELLQREIRLLDNGELEAGPVADPLGEAGIALASSLHSARLGLAARSREAAHEINRLDADAAIKHTGLGLARKLLPLHRERHDQAVRLASGSTGALSRAHILETLEKLAQSEAAEAQSREELVAIAAQRSATAAKLETALADHRHALAERLVEQVRLLEEGRISLTRLRKRFEDNVLVAPVSGIVHQLAVRSPGTVVRGGETLLILIPGREDLEIEAFASNLDAGWIKPGQAVRIKVASFPFTRHGTLTGSIRRIGADALEDPSSKELIFPLTVRLDPANCPPDLLSALVPGMACSAEIHIEKRRLIEVWLSPLRRTFSEAFRER